MKKLSKILCAVLVLAMLCSSLIFTVGAEEAADSTVTSVAASADEVAAAIKYDAEDNLFTGVLLSTNTVNGWNGENAPQAHVVTDSATGVTYFHYFVDGQFGLKEGVDGNDYINYYFTKVSLQKEDGKSEYIVLDYDMAYEKIAGTYTNNAKGEVVNGWALSSQVVHRNGSGSGLWGTGHNLANYATKEMAHVTVVYDYTTNSSYIFLDGVLHANYSNAMSAAGYEAYVAGETVVSSEFKIGSNSYDNYKLDNMYVRHIKAADAENTLDDAITAGDITKWDGNVYVGFVPSASATEHDLHDISGYKSNAAYNEMSSSNLSQLNSDFKSEIVTGSDGNSYIRVTTLKNGDVQGHFQWSIFANEDVAYDESNPTYAVFDFDIATESALTALSFITHSRTGKDGAGWDVGSGGGHLFTAESIKLAPGAFSHLTLVYDYTNNAIYYFLNNQFVKTAKLFHDNIFTSYKAGLIPSGGDGKPESSTVTPGVKIQAHASYGKTPLTAGETFALDNASVRVLTGSEAGDIAAALSAKNITAWSDNVYDEDYVLPTLPVLGSVNGKSYTSSADMLAAITAAKKEACQIEFNRIPAYPIVIRANATVNTNGMPIESLVIFDEACSNPIVDGNLYTVTLGWSVNYSVNTPNDPYTTLDLSQIKYEHSGNILSKISLSNYQTSDHRYVSFITNQDTGDVFVNDYPVGTIGSASDTYVQIAPASRIEYKKGVGQTFVFDFDMAVYDREVAALNIISRYGSNNSGAWGNKSVDTSALFEDVPLGEFAHVTIVLAVDSRIGYYFINNELVFAVENSITEVAERLEALRCFGNSTSDLLYDNVCIRNINNAEIETIAAAGDLSKWSNAIYNAEYKLPTAPTVATVDGVEYGSVEAVNDALSVDGEAAKIVEIKHVPFKGEERTFKIRTAAEVNTNGLDVSLDWNTGAYEFDPQDKNYVSSSTGLAYASSKLIHTSVDNTHYFTTIDASNCKTSATPVTWFYDNTISNYDVVFYVYGDPIAPLEYKAYVEDGVYYQDEWKEITLDESVELGYVIGDIVEEFPVASGTVSEKLYIYELVTKEVDFIVTDIKLGAVVNSNIELTVYVNKYQTLTTGDVVVLDGVEYVALRFELAPHEIDKLVEAEFIITDEEGNEYPQLQRVSFLDYAEDVLSGDYTDADKKVVANLLAYANEASVLFNGAEIDAVSALLETYASYVGSAELGEKADTSALSSVIRSAALRLNGTPEFVFKVARGFKGTITFTYQGVTGEVKENRTVDATKGEQLISLPVDVCDLQADITITAGEVSGIYNLATYAQSLENNDFAVALYNYSAAAKAHKTGLVFVYVITGYDANNDPITEIYGEYTPGSKIDIPFLRDGLTLTWYLGDGEDKVAIDINDYVITENITLSYSEVVNTTPLEIVTDEALKAINASKLKNFDNYSFVTAVKDGQPIEAIRLTRTSTWPESSDIESFWTEQSYTLDSSRKVVSLSFDYLVLGELGKHEAQSGRSYGAGIFYVKYTDTVVAEEGLTDSLKEVDSGTLFVADGQWHTVTYVASEVLELDSFLINFYKLEGDALITNIVVEYAPYETYNEDGSLNTTVVLKENVTSETLTTIVDKKIKQCDQANPGTDPATDKFAEGGTAAYVYAVKDGEYVEGLYFSRSVEWLGTEAAHFTEFRFAVNNEQAGAIVTSISFDYIVNGTVEENTRYQFTDLDGTKFYSDAYVQIKTPTAHAGAGDNYPELQGTDLVLDGEWHTMNVDLGEGVEIIDILLNLYQFQGEMVISNLVIEYAE